MQEHSRIKIKFKESFLIQVTTSSEKVAHKALWMIILVVIVLAGADVVTTLIEHLGP